MRAVIIRFFEIGQKSDDPEAYFAFLMTCFQNDTLSQAQALAAYYLTNPRAEPYPNPQVHAMAIGYLREPDTNQHVCPDHIKVTEWPDHGCIMSDKARKQWAEYRAKHGSLYSPPKLVRKNDNLAKRFSQEYSREFASPRKWDKFKRA